VRSALAWTMGQTTVSSRPVPLDCGKTICAHELYCDAASACQLRCGIVTSSRATGAGRQSDAQHVNAGSLWGHRNRPSPRRPDRRDPRLTPHRAAAEGPQGAPRSAEPSALGAEPVPHHPGAGSICGRGLGQGDSDAKEQAPVPTFAEVGVDQRWRFIE
jgi:hypothetical protein